MSFSNVLDKNAEELREGSLAYNCYRRAMKSSSLLSPPLQTRALRRRIML
jgi:hypothetical protein